MAQVRVFGGAGEIGGNKILVEDDDSRVFLDFGMSFGRMGEFYQDFSKPRAHSGLRDLLKLGVLPKLDGVYRADACRLDGIDEVLARHAGFEDLWCADVESAPAYAARTGRRFLDGLVLTHAHLDHFGDFGYLDPGIPIYCTSVTATMLRAIQRLSNRVGMAGDVTTVRTPLVKRRKGGRYPNAMFVESEKEGNRAIDRPRPIRIQEPNVPFQIGAFKVTLIPVDHSVPGAASVLVETREGKRIYYTGDVRFHGSFQEITKRLRDRVRGLEPDVMLCEGTRMDSKEGDDEENVRARLAATVGDTRGLAMVDFGWKDTTRFETVQKVAKACGRELVVGYKLAYLAKKLDGMADASVRAIEAYENVRVYRRRLSSGLYSDDDHDPLEHGYWDGEWDDEARTEEVTFAHRHNGNLRTAVDIRRHPERYVLALSQWEVSELLDIDPPANSTFTRAQCEPYDDEMAADLANQANWLRRWNIPLTYSEKHGVEIPVVAHASGHACGEHIREFVRLVSPQVVVPIHTKHESEFEGLAKSVARPKAGEVIPI